MASNRNPRYSRSWKARNRRIDEDPDKAQKLVKRLAKGDSDADKLESRLLKGDVYYDSEQPGADDLPRDNERELDDVEWSPRMRARHQLTQVGVRTKKKRAATKPNLDPRMPKRSAK